MGFLRCLEPVLNRLRGKVTVAVKLFMKTIIPLVALFFVPSTLAAASYPDGFYQVEQVVDGDTFDLADGQRVRLIGIDAPEIGQECSDQATQALASLISGQIVYLEKDVSDTDSYGRLLRYVYVDNALVNYELVCQGFAYAEEYPPDLLHSSDLAAAEDSADLNRRGCLWGVSCPSGTYVFIAFTGSTYHKAGCQYLGQSDNTICLDEALNQGYTACSVCDEGTGGGYVVVASGGCFISSVASGSCGASTPLDAFALILLAGLIYPAWQIRNER